ncbi:hypothetical protein AN958_02170 [Leucoagaricus sp. SymC.cos]|nr:hypothetical protein AN958_02170 [Leucoagaricus sp. SymC.cos]
MFACDDMSEYVCLAYHSSDRLDPWVLEAMNIGLSVLEALDFSVRWKEGTFAGHQNFVVITCALNSSTRALNNTAFNFHH